MTNKPLFISTFVFLFAGSISFSRATDISEVTLSHTHVHVAQPQRLSRTNDLILVGLKSHLGKGTNRSDSATPLKLSSAGRKLVLKDSTGLIHKASEISISWRKVPLKIPQNIYRKVVGPFSSYESANHFAMQMKGQGIPSVIAYPKDWEVWIPGSIQEIPKDIDFQVLKKTIYFQIKPVLKGSHGELLLTGPIRIEAKEGLLWKGGVYGESFLLKPDAYGTWTFIEEVAIDQYLYGVVPHEIGPRAPQNALAVQAVLARTWALANSQRFEVDGYHLCSNTQCQVYKDPQKSSLIIKKAISDTSGKILTWNRSPINAVYHATNGGVIASGQEAWSMKPVPYLRANLDGSKKLHDRFQLPLSNESSLKTFLNDSQDSYGINHYLFRWKRTLNAYQLKAALKSLNPSIGVPSSIEVLERGPSGRVLTLKINSDENGSSQVLHLDSIRRTIRKLPSTLFIINKLNAGLWEFIGGGFGHGAGLSQSGAIDLAERGWSPKAILMHYYPGTQYETLP